MVIFTIPNKPASRQQVAIDDVPYGLLLTWNERSQGWTLGLEDRDGAGLVYGRRIVLNEDLLGGSHHLDVPAGAILAIDPSGKATSVGRLELLSGEIQLIYLTAAEVENGV